MGIKTRYREKSPEEIPASEKIESEPVQSNPAAPPNCDEATERLKQQVAALQQSEEMQRLVAYASNQAAQYGYQPGTAEHQQATHQIIQHLANQKPAQPTPEPEPFRPQQSVQLPPEPDRAAMYSAPPSREAPSGNGRRELSPSQVKLSPLQRQAAALAGISEVEYARQLAKLGPYKAVRGVEHE